MEKINLQWQKCNDYLFWDCWCRLNSDLLDDPRLESRLETSFGVLRTDISGVYIIWTGIDNRTILKVGSGIIKDRLRAHLNDPKVQAYRSNGLYVTWAHIIPSLKSIGKLDNRQRGVERFLSIFLPPKLGERFPNNVDPIRVDLPEWDKSENPFLRAISEQIRNRKNPFSV